MWEELSRQLNCLLAGSSRWFLLDAALGATGRGSLFFAALAQHPARNKHCTVLSYALRLAALGAAEYYLLERVLRPNEQGIWLVEVLVRWLTGRRSRGDDPDEEVGRLQLVLELLQARDTRPPVAVSLAPRKAAANSEECAICMGAHCEVSVRGCGHRMCTGCAKRMLESQVVLSCPFCRGELRFDALGQPDQQRGLQAQHPEQQRQPVEQRLSSYIPRSPGHSTLPSPVPLPLPAPHGGPAQGFLPNQAQPFTTLDMCPPPDCLPRNMYCDSNLFLVD